MKFWSDEAMNQENKFRFLTVHKKVFLLHRAKNWVNQNVSEGFSILKKMHQAVHGWGRNSCKVTLPKMLNAHPSI